MNIQDTTSIDLLCSNNTANVFFQNTFAELEKSLGREYRIIYSDSYAVPVVIMNKLFFRYSTFESEPYQYSYSTTESEEDFIAAACLYVKERYKVQWFNMSSPAAFFMSCPKGSKRVPFGSHVINLSLTEEDLWKNVHSKHRNVIKKAEKDGVEIVCGRTEELISDYHSIDVETWKRSNKAASGKSALRNQLAILKDNAIIYMAYLDGKPQSGALFYYNDAMCYYMFGANCDKPHTGAGNLLQWHAILDMKALGVKKYSFVGCRINEDENSKYHGIQRFKERFGGELVQGFLFKIIYSNFMYKLFNVLVAFRAFVKSGRFVYPADVIDQELHKWGDLQ